jgi:hypothetical protein
MRNETISNLLWATAVSGEHRGGADAARDNRVIATLALFFGRDFGEQTEFYHYVLRQNVVRVSDHKGTLNFETLPQRSTTLVKILTKLAVIWEEQFYEPNVSINGVEV